MNIRSYLLFLVLCFPPMILSHGCTAPPTNSIPMGERTGISCTVKDSSGNPITNAEVMVVNLETQQSKSTKVGSDGSFELSVTPGKHRITVNSLGFAQHTTEIMAKPGEVAFVGLVLKASDHATRSPGPNEVVEMSFNDQVALQKWLDARAEERKHLRAVIPVEYGKSLFLFASEQSDGIANSFVERVDRPLRNDELLAHINLHPDKTFVGLHRIHDKSYLMVFRYGR